jgi:hypothetical protein
MSDRCPNCREELHICHCDEHCTARKIDDKTIRCLRCGILIKKNWRDILYQEES